MTKFVQTLGLTALVPFLVVASFPGGSVQAQNP